MGLRIYYSRRTTHVRLKWIIDDTNPRLPPGVRANDVKMPDMPDINEPDDLPSYGEHDYSSDLGEGDNHRPILDINEMLANPFNQAFLNGPNGLQFATVISNLANQVAQRNRQRRSDRLNPPQQIQQRQFYDVEMLPPPPIPQDPINYP